MPEAMIHQNIILIHDASTHLHCTYIYIYIYIYIYVTGPELPPPGNGQRSPLRPLWVWVGWFGLGFSTSVVQVSCIFCQTEQNKSKYVMQVFELSGFRRHDEPDEKSYKYQCVFINVCLSIFSPGTFSRVSTSSANHKLERRVLFLELLRSRMAPEKGTLTEIIDLNKESPSRGPRPYHWVGGGPRILRPDTYIYIYIRPLMQVDGTDLRPMCYMAALGRHFTFNCCCQGGC